MNLSTRQMRAFRHVAHTGSFTRAAELTHMTQAGLSILVREMERQLGVRLFDRTTRTVHLTAAGRRLAPVVERVLRELDDVTGEIGALGAAARQNLRIAATPLVSAHLLPRLLALFREQQPQVQVRLLDSSLDDVQKSVMAGEADLGLGFFFKASTGLARTPVASFRLMRVTAAGGAARDIGRVPWSSLRSADLIGLPAENPIQKLIDAQLAKLHIGPAERRSVSFFSTLISMVEAGFGTAVMPTFAMAACKRHEVNVDLLTAPGVELAFYRIAKRGTRESEAMRAFIALLEEKLPSMAR
ncbi:MAG: LysR family transcriptional regulator [Gammaproteobacteria bacterium]|nr:LysR family transcriptional regulator [Gammaproteobacteria bacterium]MBU1444321.1 LysR family transcriptional regulator [Gammaproteobacteria bacterium]MBU2285582.1 LysR family transcriptional regulator [Gammaproteobacteria bacterium]MBU2409982.1 LysR family transcriptional regulator [Gammaproteobacteria bacterium]